MADPDTHPLARRPTYSPSQLQQYLMHLHRNLRCTQQPLSYLETLKESIKSSPLQALKTLMRLHLSSIPWGNIALHYSPHHALPLGPPSYLFDKLVTRNRGGYCMEQNLLFSTILRSLGYEFYLTGGRVSTCVGNTGRPSKEDLETDEKKRELWEKIKEGYGGWEHMIILVTIQERKYVVDVGFGSGNALEPVLLEEGVEVGCQPGMRGRVVRRGLLGSTQRVRQEMWVYQNRVVGKREIGGVGHDVGEGGVEVMDEEKGWTNAYCFSELEWFEEDFAVSNYKTSMSPSSWFTWTFVVTRMVLRGEEAAGKEGTGGGGQVSSGERKDTAEAGENNMGEDNVEVVGSVTMFGGKLTRRVGGGESEVLKECKTEAERVTALREWFAVELREEEREGIRRKVTELEG